MEMILLNGFRLLLLWLVCDLLFAGWAEMMAENRVAQE